MRDKFVWERIVSLAVEMVESPESHCVLLRCCEKNAQKNQLKKGRVMLLGPSHTSSRQIHAVYNYMLIAKMGNKTRNPSQPSLKMSW